MSDSLAEMSSANSSMYTFSSSRRRFSFRHLFCWLFTTFPAELVPPIGPLTSWSDDVVEPVAMGLVVALKPDTWLLMDPWRIEKCAGEFSPDSDSDTVSDFLLLFPHPVQRERDKSRIIEEINYTHLETRVGHGIEKMPSFQLLEWLALPQQIDCIGCLHDPSTMLVQIGEGNTMYKCSWNSPGPMLSGKEFSLLLGTTLILDYLSLLCKKESLLMAFAYH